MTTTRDKQVLRTVDPEAVKRTAAEGGALTLKELSVVLNYSYQTVREFAAMPGFPMLASKVTLEDFKEWKRRKLGLLSQPTSERRPRSASDKS